MKGRAMELLFPLIDPTLHRLPYLTRLGFLTVPLFCVMWGA